MLSSQCAAGAREGGWKPGARDYEYSAKMESLGGYKVGMDGGAFYEGQKIMSMPRSASRGGNMLRIVLLCAYT